MLTHSLLHLYINYTDFFFPRETFLLYINEVASPAVTRKWFTICILQRPTERLSYRGCKSPITLQKAGMARKEMNSWNDSVTTTAPRYSYSDQDNQWQIIKGNTQHLKNLFQVSLWNCLSSLLLLWKKHLPSVEKQKDKTPLRFHQMWVSWLNLVFFPSRKWNYLAFVLLILLISWMIYSLTLHSFNSRQRFRAFMSWTYSRKCRKYYISTGKINEGFTHSHTKQRNPFTQVSAWVNNEMHWLSHWQDSLPSSTLDEQEKTGIAAGHASAS